MNRTILSLAILKTNWDKLKKDYLENFVPFVATLINKYDYTSIEPVQISQHFKSEFGLNIPVHPIITILTRCIKRDLIQKDRGLYITRKEKALEMDFSKRSSEQQRNIEKVLAELRTFASERFNQNLTDKELEEAFIAYLKEHDLDILFAAEFDSPLPAVNNPQKIKYIVNAFITESFKREPQTFRFIQDISIGHALAAAIHYKEFNSFSGKLNDVVFYLDTRFTIRLLGLEGEHRKASAEELTKVLREENAKVRIFDVTLKEIEGILYDCLAKLQKGTVDVNDSSKVFQYLSRAGKTPSDVEDMIVKLSTTLNDHKIIVNPLPDYDTLKKYQIDENQLNNLIVHTYSSFDPYFNKEAKESTIRRDVIVISGIYRIRKGTQPRTIKESKAIFVTTNNALAFACRRFETQINGNTFTIPTCLTDVFVGTLIWLQSPSRVKAFSEKKIIADCYAAMQPTDILIHKYMEAVEQLKREMKITNDEYYLLRTHRGAMNLLEEKTMGDPEAFDIKTPEEILDEIIASIKQQERELYLTEKNQHNATRQQLNDVVIKHHTLDSGIQQRADQLAKLFANTLTGLFFLIIIVSLTYRFYPSLIPWLEEYKDYLLAVGLLLSLAGLFVTVRVKNIREKIRVWFSKRIETFLKGNGA